MGELNGRVPRYRQTVTSVVVQRQNGNVEEVAYRMEFPDICTVSLEARKAAARSFVVQLCDPADPTPAKAIGRVENVATGECAYFYSMQELEEFMRRTAKDSA